MTNYNTAQMPVSLTAVGVGIAHLFGWIGGHIGDIASAMSVIWLTGTMFLTIYDRFAERRMMIQRGDLVGLRIAEAQDAQDVRETAAALTKAGASVSINITPPITPKGE